MQAFTHPAQLDFGYDFVSMGNIDIFKLYEGYDKTSETSFGIIIFVQDIKNPFVWKEPIDVYNSILQRSTKNYSNVEMIIILKKCLLRLQNWPVSMAGEKEKTNKVINDELDMHYTKLTREEMITHRELCVDFSLFT